MNDLSNESLRSHLLKHSISRRMFARILAPSLIASVAFALSDLSDALVLGTRLGMSGLMAVGIISPLFDLFSFIGYSFSVGGCVTHVRFTAEDREEAALSHFKTCLLLVLLVGGLLALAGNLLINPLMLLLGADESRPGLLAQCLGYARPLLCAIPLFLLNYLLYDFVRCDDGTFLASLGLSVGCILDLALNIWFVLGLGWGVSGAALAVIIAQAVSILIYLAHLFSRNGVLHFRPLWRAKLGRFRAVRRSVRIGLTSSARYVFELAFVLLGNRLLLRAGDLGLIDGDLYVAVFDLVMSVSCLVFGIFRAYADTMQPLATAFHTENDRDNLRYLLSLAVWSCVGACVLVSALLCFFAGSVSRAFGLESAAELAVSVPAIRIFCISTPMAGMLNIMISFFQSTGQARRSGIATMLHTAVFPIPAAIAAGLWFPQYFWFLFAASEFCTLAVVLLLARGRLIPKKLSEIPVLSTTMNRRHHDIQEVLGEITAFCARQELPEADSALIRLSVEELCVIIVRKAFTGRRGEYIQLTVAEEEKGRYTINMRNNASYFNPLELRMGRISREIEDDELLESLGVLLVSKKARFLGYRHYQGFNLITVKI